MAAVTWREQLRWRWVKVRRAWCRVAHSWWTWEPDNGLGWTGSHCTKCGYRYFGQWNCGALTEGMVRKGGVNAFPSQITERPPAPGPIIRRRG